LKHLIELDLGLNGNIENITPISNITTLQNLTLKVNLIKNITPLKFLSNLTTLNLSLNQVDDITPLWRLNNLVFLDLSANMYLRYIGQLSSLTNLKILNLCACDINSKSYIIRLEQNLPNCKIFHSFM
jgi:internalin A